MKRIYKYSLLMLSAMFLFSCEKETEDISKITYYCDLTLKGNATELVPLGGTYNEPGWEASENGEDISDAVIVSGTLNTNVAGLYKLTYKVNNSDGFPTIATRQVVVADATPSPLVSGLYTVTGSSYRKVISTGVTVAYGRDFEILIYQLSPGRFYVSDLFGGWYAQRAGYGAAYEMNSEVKLNADNTFDLVKSHNAGWGDGMSDFYDASYDPATATISWAPEYVGSYIFYQTITKQ
ncbi:hypothetical protein FACS189440_18480 [Bacteroidia bacterium]|nr:hypothetical protein FACS189423_11270 [Bacteroidia bacterium]GHT50662.1 hypothetical protein FACS189440_18480 [Bacteroidia bacterium]